MGYQREVQHKDGRTLLIREGVREDAEPMLAFIHTISGESDYLSFGGGEFDNTLAQQADDIESYLKLDNAIYLLGLIDNQIVGWIFVKCGKRPRVRHIGELGVAVLKAEWGKGVGAHLMDSLLEWARASDVVTRLTLRTRADNEVAFKWYERAGFTKMGTDIKGLCIDGEYFDSHWMGMDV